MLKCVIVPNFAAVVQSMIEIALLRCGSFSIFKMADVRHRGFLKFLMVGHVRRVELRHCAKLWSKSVEPRPRYGDFFRFFKMAAAAMLDFKFLKF